MSMDLQTLTYLVVGASFALYVGIALLSQRVMPPGLDNKDKIKRLKRYFQENYTYELGVEFDPSLDPLDDFLRNKRRGHCEFFAM